MVNIEELREEIRDSFFNLFWYHRPRLDRELYITEVLYCPRKAWFNYYFPARKKVSVRALYGTIMHNVLSELDFFEDKEADFEVSLSMDYKGWKISGRADVITKNPEAIWEFKFPMKLGNENVEPVYVMQVMAYMSMSGIKQGYLVEVDLDRMRNDISVRVIPVSYDPSVLDAFKQKLDYLISCLETRELPNGPEFSWECRDCPYSVLCEKLGGENGGEGVRKGNGQNFR